MMKFSERKGYKPVPVKIQRESISNELRISLWNFFDEMLFNNNGFIYARFGEPGEVLKMARFLWYELKIPMDSLPNNGAHILREIRTYFFNAKWFDVYDFLEIILKYIDNPEYYSLVNNILEAELAGYRFVDNVLTDITSKEEIDAIQEAIATDEYEGVKIHLRTALELLSDRKKPDYRNSVKESISAVESIAREITGNSKATLGDALKILDKNCKLHPALKDGFSKIYGYTSDEGGIRHAMLEETTIDSSDAIFFLVACSAFINYLKNKK